MAGLAVSGGLTEPLLTQYYVAEGVVLLTGQLIHAGLYDIEVRSLPVSREYRADEGVCRSLLYRSRLCAPESLTVQMRSDFDV